MLKYFYIWILFFPTIVFAGNNVNPQDNSAPGGSAIADIDLAGFELKDSVDGSVSIETGDTLDIGGSIYLGAPDDGKVKIDNAAETTNICLDVTTDAVLEILDGDCTSAGRVKSSAIEGGIMYSGYYSAAAGAADGITLWDTAFDQTLLASGVNTGRHIIVTDAANYTKDHDHAAQTNPTLYVHSAEDPDTDNTEWISITHDGTYATIDSGTGTVQINDTLRVTQNFVLLDDKSISLGNSGADFGLDFSTAQATANATVMGLDDAGHTLIITEWTNKNQDHDHAAQANPTVFIHSATDPDTANDEWVSITHDVTNALISVGSGVLAVEPALALTPSADTAYLAAAAITASNGRMRVEGDSGAVILTSTPSIVDGVDGQCVTLVGVDETNTLTLQDRTNLGSSGIENGGVDIALANRDVAKLCYDSGDDLWIVEYVKDNTGT